MSVMKQLLSSVFTKNGAIAAAGTASAGSRAVLVSSGVVAGWLLVNVVAYGSLALPPADDGGLLADRRETPRPGGATRTAETLPSTPFFGVAAQKAQGQPEIDLANIPITQLNLVLSGVLSSSVDDNASALIAEKGKPAQRYYVGDSLSGGAEVYSVAVDHIVLNRNGKMEKLTYPDADGRPTIPKQYAHYARQAASMSANTTNSRGDKQESIRKRLEQLREMARSRQTDRSN